MEKYSYNPEKEGLLSEDNKECSILFILKEPIPKEETDNSFWLRDKVIPAKGKGITYGEKYYSYLTKLASTFNIPLKECGYINLYPFASEETPSQGYLDFLKSMEMRTEAAKKRMECIEILNPKMIVACREVYNAIAKYYSPVSKADKCLVYEGREYPFKSCKLNIMDKKIPMFAFYHPSYPIDLKNNTIDIKAHLPG